jgi:hypothetical protein
VPISLGGLIAPPLGKGFDVRFVAPAGFEDRPAIEIEELVDLAEGIGVGAPHEAVPDQAHIERFLVAHRELRP